MTPLVILLVVLVNVCNVFADTLIVSGGFSSIGDFEDSSMVRYNGWYFDKDYHVQLQSGKIYSMCQSRGATYLGGDFVAYTYQGTSQYFMHTNSYFPSNPPNNPPVIVVPDYGYSNDYQLYTYYTWTHDDYDEDDTDEYMDDDDDDDDDGLFDGDDDDDDDDDDGGGGIDDDDDDDDDGDDRKRGVRKREGHFIDGVYYDYPLRNGTGTNTTTTNGTTININPNLDGAVYDLFCLEEFVVVAGNFTSANNVTLNNVGMWQTGNHTWMPFGTGLNGPVYAIAAYGQFFYMGGAFNLAGGFNDTPPIAVSNLARWGFVNQTWSSMNVNISGTILDMAISQDGSLLFIGGNFTVPSIMKGLGHIRNFLVIDLTTGSIANTEGTNGTVRKLFIRHNQPGVVVAGNFGLWGFDEVRVWIDDRKWEPYNILFAGEVTTISVFNNGDTIAVGGQFEAAIVDGKWRQMYYLAIKRGDSAWEEVENINGPVYAMLSQVTSRTLLFAFIIAGLGVTVLCWFTIPCRATPHTTSPYDHVNHSKMPKFSFLFLPFMAVVALACALHLPFILMSIPKFQGAFDSFERFQFLFEITHLWTPVLHIDLLVGFMLSCPFIAPPLMGAVWYMGREGRARIQYNYSFKFRHARSLAYALACFDVWLLMLLVYYLASPLPDFLGRNSFLMGACFVVIEAIVAFLLARTVNFNKNGDTSIYLMLNSSFYISSRIALASLLAISPSIPNAISFFVPCISFILHLIRHIGNSTSSKRIVYRSISDGGQDESEYELPAQACFTKVQKVIFNVRNAAAKNEAHRAIMIYKQFLETVIDFFFLSGYNPLTPFFLMAFATCHYVMISRERAARAVLGGVTHATFTFTLVLCTFGSPMAPGLFMSWRSPVMLSSLFASVLLSATCISYTVFSRKVPFVQWTFGTIYLCMGLVAYAMVWTYAGNWSTEVPLIVYAITLIIVIGSIYAVKRYM